MMKRLRRLAGTRMIIPALALFFILLAIDALTRSRTSKQALKANFLTARFAVSKVLRFNPAHRLVEFLEQSTISRLKPFHRQCDAFGIGDIGLVAANFRFITLFAALIELIEDFLPLLID